MDMQKLEIEVDRNYDSFLTALPSILPLRRGEHVLLRDGVMVDFFRSEGDALAAGRERFADGLYSVQEVTERPVDLGFFSHAINSRIA